MNTVNVDGAIAWGATWRQLLKPRTDNPFPDAPGWYVKRKAWFYGFDNAVEILSKQDELSPNDPVYDDIRNPKQWEPLDGRHTRRTIIWHHDC